MQTVRVIGDHERITFVKPYPVESFRDAMKYRVDGYFFTRAYKNGFWDGYKSMMSNHSISTGLYRAMREQLARDNGVRFEEQIHWPAPPRLLPGEHSEREWQNECVAEMLRHLPLGGGILLAATASGKTRMAAYFYQRVPGNHLFLVDQRKLLHQAREDIAAVLSGETVGIVGDGQYDLQRVTVATVQTLAKKAKLKALLRYMGTLATVIVDELHVQLSKRNFNIVEAAKPLARYGLTATLQTEKDEVNLRASSFAGPVIYKYPIERGIREGVLSSAKYVQIRFVPHVSARELKEQELDDWTENVLQHPDKHTALRRLTHGYLKRDRYVVVLADLHKHIDKIHQTIMEYQPMLATGKVKLDRINGHIEDFEAGRHRLILASRVFNKGISIRRIDTVISLGETEDENTIVQQIGRALRLHDEKRGVLFVDFACTTGKFRAAGAKRLQAVKDAGIPTEVYRWDRERQQFFTAVKPQSKD